MRLLFIIASLMVPDLVRADESGFAAFLLEEQTLSNHFDDGVMHVNGREFLMGDLHDWPRATDDFSASFMVRSSIWLREFLDEDSVLKYQDFEIRRTQDSSHTGVQYLAGHMALAPSSPQNNTIFYYNLTLDPPLQVEGYDTYSNGSNRLRFLPKNSEIAHGFTCFLNPREGSQIGDLTSCSVVVVYPFATNIVFNGYRYRPGTLAEYGPNFTAIAERMLEVVTCIDITDDQNSDRPTDLSHLLESHPNLADCEIDLMG